MTQIITEYNHLPAIIAALPKVFDAVIKEVILDIETDIKADMAQPKSGLMYGEHQASKPGESPAVDIGNLIATVGSEMVKPGLGAVYVGTDYAEPLNYGTVHMKPRPFMEPAADRAKPRIEQMLADGIEDILREMAGDGP